MVKLVLVQIDSFKLCLELWRVADNKIMYRIKEDTKLGSWNLSCTCQFTAECCKDLIKWRMKKMLLFGLLLLQDLETMD